MPRCRLSTITLYPIGVCSVTRADTFLSRVIFGNTLPRKISLDFGRCYLCGPKRRRRICGTRVYAVAPHAHLLLVVGHEEVFHKAPSRKAPASFYGCDFKVGELPYNGVGALGGGDEPVFRVFVYEYAYGVALLWIFGHVARGQKYLGFFAGFGKVCAEVYQTAYFHILIFS